MNPGIVEETGQTARSVIDALKSQPMTITMILSNLLLLGFIWYSQVENNRAWSEENVQRSINAKNFVEYAQRTNELLARCVVPGG